MSDKPGFQILISLLRTLSPIKQREWYLKIMMDVQGKTLQDLAGGRNGITPWYLAEGIAGKIPLSRRMIKKFESSLKINLVPFLTQKEILRFAGKRGRINEP